MHTIVNHYCSIPAALLVGLGRSWLVTFEGRIYSLPDSWWRLWGSFAIRGVSAEERLHVASIGNGHGNMD